MSLTSIYERKAKAEQEAAHAATVELNAGVYHAWAIMWHVKVERASGFDKLLFNPKNNLNNARDDDATINALSNIAHCNEVFRTRIHLCELPCVLMSYKPEWQVLHIPGGKLCAQCEHNITHQVESFQALPDEAKAELRKHWERSWPECRLDARGIMVLRDAR